MEPDDDLLTGRGLFLLEKPDVIELERRFKEESHVKIPGCEEKTLADLLDIPATMFPFKFD